MASTLKNLRPESAKKMMSEMSNKQTFVWIGVAAVFHLILIVATSWGFIRVHFLGGSPTPSPTVQAPTDSQAQTSTPSPAAAPDATASSPTDKTPTPDSKPPVDVKPAVSTATPDSPSPKPAVPGKTPDAKSPSHEGLNLDDSTLK